MSYKEKKEEDEEPEELGDEEVLETENEKLWEFTVKDLYLKTYENIRKDFEEGLKETIGSVIIFIFNISL
jgi:hypothetical protein